MNNHHLTKSFWQTLIDFLFPPMTEKLSGRLCVSGKGSSEFIFQGSYPETVFVHFDDEACPPAPCNPCDPGQEDLLDWKIIRHHHHYILIIEWDVSNMRQIDWKVC